MNVAKPQDVMSTSENRQRMSLEQLVFTCHAFESSDCPQLCVPLYQSIWIPRFATPGLLPQAVRFFLLSPKITNSRLALAYCYLVSHSAAYLLLVR